MSPAAGTPQPSTGTPGDALWNLAWASQPPVDILSVHLALLPADSACSAAVQPFLGPGWRGREGPALSRVPQGPAHVCHFARVSE